MTGSACMSDGKLFLEDWHDGGSRRIAKEIAFHAGESHEIKLEYYQDGGAAVLQLGWMLNNVDPAVEAVALARESDQIIAVMGFPPPRGEEMSVSFKGFAGGTGPT